MSCGAAQPARAARLAREWREESGATTLRPVHCAQWCRQYYQPPIGPARQESAVTTNRALLPPALTIRPLSPLLSVTGSRLQAPSSRLQCLPHCSTVTEGVTSYLRHLHHLHHLILLDRGKSCQLAHVPGTVCCVKIIWLDSTRLPVNLVTAWWLSCYPLT